MGIRAAGRGGLCAVLSGLLETGCGLPAPAVSVPADIPTDRRCGDRQGLSLLDYGQYCQQQSAFVTVNIVNDQGFTVYRPPTSDDRYASVQSVSGHEGFYDGREGARK